MSNFLNTSYFKNQLSVLNECDFLDPKNMHTVRIIVKRGNKVKLLQNQENLSGQEKSGDRDGKCSHKLGKFEIPGGKVADSSEEYNKMVAGRKNEDIEKFFLDEAMRELGEECGMYFSRHRFQKVGVQSRPIEKKFNPFPQAENFITHFYFIDIKESEYKDNIISDANYLTLDNDDNHVAGSWEEINFDGSLEELLARNSLIHPDIIEQIPHLIDMNKVDMQQKVSDIIDAGIYAKFYENGKVDKRKKKGAEEDHPLSSLVDIELYDMGEERFYELYKKAFGRTVSESLEFDKDLMVNDLVGVLGNLLLKFHDTYDNNQRVKNMILGLQHSISKIKTSKDLYDFFITGIDTGVGNFFYRLFVSLKKISGLSYYPYITEDNFDLFSSVISEKMDIGDKGILKDCSGGKCEYKKNDNMKSLERMVIKTITKPLIDAQKIKDVFRASFTVEEGKEDKIAKIIQKKLGSNRNTAEGSFRLIKKISTKNLASGKSEDTVTLIGSFPILNKDGKVIERVPVEIQVISEEDYKKSYMGIKEHSVYELFQSLGGNYARGNLGVSNYRISENFDRLSQDDNGKIDQNLRNDIKQEAWRYTFPIGSGQVSNGKKKRVYYSYRNVLNYQKISELVYKQDEIFLGMCNFLTKEYFSDSKGMPIDIFDWTILFDVTSSEEAIQTVISKNNAEIFAQIFKEKKFGLPLDHTKKILKICEKNGIKKTA